MHIIYLALIKAASSKICLFLNPQKHFFYWSTEAEFLQKTDI